MKWASEAGAASSCLCGGGVRQWWWEFGLLRPGEAVPHALCCPGPARLCDIPPRPGERPREGGVEEASFSF